MKYFKSLHTLQTMKVNEDGSFQRDEDGNFIPDGDPKIVESGTNGVYAMPVALEDDDPRVEAYEKSERWTTIKTEKEYSEFSKKIAEEQEKLRVRNAGGNGNGNNNGNGNTK